jgi:adenylate cyclase
MAEDPGFALPVAWAARWHSLRIGRGWSSRPAEDAVEAMALASRAVALDRRNALALATFGHLKTILHRDSEGAMECFDEALAACPNSSLAWTLSSATQSYLGHGAEAVRRAERGMRLSPFDPLRFSQRLFLAIAHYASGNHEQAVHWTSASLRENPLHAATLKIRTGVLAAVGRMEEARAAATHLLAVEPGFRLGTYARTRQPFRHPELEQKFLGHLRQAGLPE